MREGVDELSEDVCEYRASRGPQFICRHLREHKCPDLLSKTRPSGLCHCGQEDQLITECD